MRKDYHKRETDNSLVTSTQKCTPYANNNKTILTTTKRQILYIMWALIWLFFVCLFAALRDAFKDVQAVVGQQVRALSTIIQILVFPPTVLYFQLNFIIHVLFFFLLSLLFVKNKNNNIYPLLFVFYISPFFLDLFSYLFIFLFIFLFSFRVKLWLRWKSKLQVQMCMWPRARKVNAQTHSSKRRVCVFAECVVVCACSYPSILVCGVCMRICISTTVASIFFIFDALTSLALTSHPLTLSFFFFMQN